MYNIYINRLVQVKEIFNIWNSVDMREGRKKERERDREREN